MTFQVGDRVAVYTVTGRKKVYIDKINSVAQTVYCFDREEQGYSGHWYHFKCCRELDKNDNDIEDHSKSSSKSNYNKIKDVKFTPQTINTISTLLGSLAAAIIASALQKAIEKYMPENNE